MANQSIKSNNGTLKWVLIALFTFGAVGMGLAVGLTTGTSLSGGPNAQGAQASEYINPLPNSPIYKTLGDLQRYSNPELYLAKDGKFLDEYALNLQKLQEMLAPANGDENTASDPAFARLSATNIKELRRLVTSMLTEQIPQIRQYVGANTPGQALPVVKQLIENRGRLNELWYPASAEQMITTAVALAKENAASSFTKYQYDQGQRNNLTTGQEPLLSDCSSFVSHLLIQAGVLISKDTPFTTIDLYRFAKKREFGLSLVAESSNEAGIPKDEITAGNLIQPGFIILSSDRPFSTGKTDASHASVYIGAAADHPGDLVESSNREGGRNGIQFNTLENRYASSNPIQAIIRYGGGQ